METDTDDEQMMEALSKLDVQAQEHFRAVVRLLALCYTSPELFSGLLITRCEDETLMTSLNANEMEAAEILSNATKFIGAVVTHDAPPRDQFN
tara:strand:+ start:75 stop:353 length:279 start_codon:yes stop_codon:yes gene_type:complete